MNQLDPEMYPTHAIDSVIQQCGQTPTQHMASNKITSMLAGFYMGREDADFCYKLEFQRMKNKPVVTIIDENKKQLLECATRLRAFIGKQLIDNPKGFSLGWSDTFRTGGQPGIKLQHVDTSYPRTKTYSGREQATKETMPYGTQNFMIYHGFPSYPY